MIMIYMKQKRHIFFMKSFERNCFGYKFTVAYSSHFTAYDFMHLTSIYCIFMSLRDLKSIPINLSLPFGDHYSHIYHCFNTFLH